MRAKEFYNFINEREAIRIRKQQRGSPPSWTDDPIFQQFKFTNVQRFQDRTTQWLVKNMYDPNRDRPHEEILRNCAMFRYFGTIEFARAVGWRKRWNPTQVAQVAKNMRARGEKVFTGAYVITNANIQGPKEEVICHRFLTPFHEACPRLIKIAKDHKRWSLVFMAMRPILGFGGTGFMAKEVLQDALLTPALHYVQDRDTWSPITIGSLRGLNRVFDRVIETRVDQLTALIEMRQLRTMSKHHGARYLPKLSLHDIQFQLCEFDKYERVRLGQGRPRNRYTPSKEPMP